MQNLTKTIEQFLEYAYKGDGKYYTVEQGSRHYNQSIFQKFANKNSNFFSVKDSGNDAPKGGQTGNYVIVEFTDSFKALAADFNAKKEGVKQAKQQAENQKISDIETYAKLIETIESEQRSETERRLSLAIGQKINSTVFHKAVSAIRNRNIAL